MTKERWSFDGHGINGSDKYKSRIATLVKPASNDREEWEEFTRCGKLMAAAPEMLTALERIDKTLDLLNDDEITLYIGKAKVRDIKQAIARAKGEL